MRLLMCHPGASYSVADVHNGWLRGFRKLGVDARAYNLNERLFFFSEARIPVGKGKGRRYKYAFDEDQAIRLAAKSIQEVLYEWWPDVVVIVSGFYLFPHLYRVMRDRNHKVVLFFTESPYEDDQQLLKAPHADVVVVNDPTNLDKFKAANPRSLYIPHAYDPDIHKPGPGTEKSDFCFVGTGFKSRVEFFEQVDWSGIDVALGGNWFSIDDTHPLHRFLRRPDDCVPNEETVGWYQGAKASANLYRQEANATELVGGWAMGPREVELAACGTFFLRDLRPEGDEVFPMLPTFTEPGEFSEKLRWWLAREPQRTETARKAREAVADRTFENHAKQLLAYLERT